MKKKEKNHEKGLQSEDRATEFLRKQGYEILERNYRFHKNEIDIIARDGVYYVFIEVKARTDTQYGYAYQAVGRTKADTIRKVAMDYLYKQRLSLYDTPCRFDIISIDAGVLRHYPNAF